MTEAERYSATWRKYRRLRRVFWALVLGWLPGLAVLFRFFPELGAGPAFVWMGAIVVVHTWRAFVRCPRCGQPFSFSGYSNPFTSKCLHCGLRIGEGPAPAFAVERRSQAPRG
jgi:hypothetical protein